MSVKKAKLYAISTAILTVFALLWNGLVHLVILGGEERLLEPIHRSDMADKMWIAIVVTVVITLFYSVSYDRWRKTGSCIEAAWHSLYFGIAIIIIVDLNQYAQYALPFSLVAKWAMYGLIEFLLYGQIARWAYNRLANK